MMLLEDGEEPVISVIEKENKTYYHMLFHFNLVNSTIIYYCPTIIL